MRALPYTYRSMPGKPGTLAQFNIAGECGGSWYLFGAAMPGDWFLLHRGKNFKRQPCPQEIAWRIFTKGIAREAAKSQVHVNWRHRNRTAHTRMVSIVEIGERGDYFSPR